MDVVELSRRRDGYSCAVRREQLNRCFHPSDQHVLPCPRGEHGELLQVSGAAWAPVKGEGLSPMWFT